MILIGCCGFAGGMKTYFEEFKVVEVQKTFYKIPRENTLEKWRTQAPNDFEFTVKATQLITHPPTSPTYRKAKIIIPQELHENYGSFRPTEEVFSAWESNKHACKILNARICIFQTPKSFRPTEENLENMKIFFKKIERDQLILGWEPRGKEWSAELIKDLCDSLNLIHVTDPFRQLPTYIVEEIAYLRLHGSPPGKKMYSYKYTKEDFGELIKKISTIKAEFPHIKKIYVMFNNISMREDCKAFQNFLRERRSQ